MPVFENAEVAGNLTRVKRYELYLEQGVLVKNTHSDNEEKSYRSPDLQGVQ